MHGGAPSLISPSNSMMHHGQQMQMQGQQQSHDDLFYQLRMNQLQMSQNDQMQNAVYQHLLQQQPSLYQQGQLIPTNPGNQLPGNQFISPSSGQAPDLSNSFAANGVGQTAQMQNPPSMVGLPNNQDPDIINVPPYNPNNQQQ